MLSWHLNNQDACDLPKLYEPIQLIWTDPPFGTGKVQHQGGNKYKDCSDTDYVIEALIGWSRYLADEGVLVTLCDYRLAYDLVPAMVESGLYHRGDIIWEFGLGRPRTSWWPNRHNIISTFTREANSGKFNPDAIPRVKRIANSPGYPDDKPAGSVWDYTMSNSSSERVGYPNQKPLAVVEPFVKAHTETGDLVMDPFCGSSTTGVAALNLNRKYIGYDTNQDALNISAERLQKLS